MFRQASWTALLFSVLVTNGTALARPAVPSPEMLDAQPAWCAPEVEALPGGDVCFIDGTRADEKRTLVIYLHGLIAKNTTWQWTQERAILREAKRLGFAAIVPRAPLAGRDRNSFVWPASAKEPPVEEQLVNGWSAARRLIEARAGRPFDEVFVVGFSSGAYYGASLALRGRLDVDGYALLAGGEVVTHPAGDLRRRPPIFVGVCTKDRTTVADSRSLGRALANWSWRHRVDEEPVSHMVADVHMGHALGYLRNAARGSK